MFDESFATRFWSRVTKSEESGCWEWTMAKAPTGYGILTLARVKRYAHRTAYELANGPIPDGLFVCHHCDNPPCINPAHLFLGSQKDNMQDASRKGRSRGGVAFGDANGARRHPERLARGETHNSRTKPWTVLRGEGHGRAKLTDQEVRDIRNRFSTGGYTQQELARTFNISPSQMGNIIHMRQRQLA